MGPDAVLGRCILRRCDVGKRRDGYGPGSSGNDRQVWDLGKMRLFLCSSSNCVLWSPDWELTCTWSSAQVPVPGRTWPEAPRGWRRPLTGHTATQPHILHAADEGDVPLSLVLGEQGFFCGLNSGVAGKLSKYLTGAFFLAESPRPLCQLTHCSLGFC